MECLRLTTRRVVESPLFSDETLWAAGAAVAAGETLLIGFHSADHNYANQKFDGTAVTRIDREIDDVLHRLIAERFPDDSRMGEESNDSGSQSPRTWIFDPVDGTGIGLQLKVPVTCISIARCDDGDPVFGALYNPLTGVLVLVEKDRGSYEWDFQSNGCKAPRDALVEYSESAFEIRESENRLAAASWNRLVIDHRPNEARNSFFVNGHPDDQLTIPITRELERQGMVVRRLDATVQAGICLLTSGGLGGVLLPRGGPWDFAALKLAVEEAGGMAAIYQGRTLESRVDRLDVRSDVGGIFATDKASFELLEIAAATARHNTMRR